MREVKSIKSQDVLVLIWLILHHNDRKKRLLDISLAIGISQSELTWSLQRLVKSKLITDDRVAIKAAAIEFLISGVKYFFPAEPGPVTRGMLTAQLENLFGENLSSKSGYVWADPQGKVRGESIPPIYKSAPEAAKKDLKLYELLALLDAIRVGRAREAGFAIEVLRKKIKEA